MRFVAAAALLLAIAPQCAVANDGSIARLPRAERWLAHVTDELMPFWTTEAALGNPVGAFPTTRCDDGSQIDRTNLCPEVARNPWLLASERTVVALSRQTYGYGVAFHMTGDAKYLEYMRAGVRYMRQNTIDRDRGGMFTRSEPGSGLWGPKTEWRNPQELAYSLLGLSFYYYLTRDPEVLPDLTAIKDYIVTTYYNPNLGVFQWLLEDNGSERALDKRLVAQLDQMNAYLVLLAPILPEPYGGEWKDTLRAISRFMIDHFYSPEENLFFLTANRPEDLDIRTAAADFGHTIKAMWMVRNAGLLNQETERVEWAETQGLRVLERAYMRESGSWAQGVLRGGAIDANKSWWSYAELDQFAASLALTKPGAAVYLPETYDYWFNYFVDRQHGEVWNGVEAATNGPIRQLPKAWAWKSAYHSLEHALVAYITTRRLHGEPLKLYYAFTATPAAELIRPYFYIGAIEGIEAVPGTPFTAVTFRDVR